MRFKNHLLSENFVSNIFKKIIKKPANSAMKEIKAGFKEFISYSHKLDEPAQKDVLRLINRAMGTNYKSIDDLAKVYNNKISESFELNEDFKHWWAIIKDQGWFNITFYPALQVWFEIGSILTNLLKNEPIDPTSIKKAAFFGVLWIALASGKFIKEFFQWKKQNPEEYAQERGKEVKMSNRDLLKFT